MKCTTRNCFGEHLAKGLCTKCYYRVKRGGTPELSKKQAQALRKCEVVGCGKPHDSKGLCSKHFMAKKRAENPELRLRESLRTASYKKTHLEQDKVNQAHYRRRHQEYLATYYKQWREKNIEQYLAYHASRKKRVRKATPPWADLEQIRNFYYNCPEGYQVDHIVPINGKNVSGLHVSSNLQYLTKLANLSKGNRFS